MTTTHPLREKLTAGPAAALAATRAMGRVMLSASGGGATHERIGPVDEVVIAGDRVRLGGAAHAATVDLGVIAAVVADRSGKMKDKAMPRLEFQTAGGDTVFSLIGLEGLEPFDAALANLGAGEPLPEKPRPAPGAAPAAPPALDEADEGLKPLAAAAASGEALAVRFSVPGFDQSWQGVVKEVKPAMGFHNIIQGDFHLHLKGGAVASWRRQDKAGAVELHALDADGGEIGLVLSAPPAAFAAL